MIIKKRQVLTTTLIIALFAALTVNWYFTSPQNTTNEAVKPDEAVTGNLGDTLFVAGTTATDNENNISVDDSAVKSELVSNEVKTSEESANAEEYFSQAKLKRTNAYDKVIEDLEKIINNDNIDKAEKNKVSVMLTDYKTDMKVQTDTENLISAKIGSQCLVIINNENCQVILEKNTLNETIILQISEIIEKNTDIFPENLTIIELK